MPLPPRLFIALTAVLLFNSQAMAQLSITTSIRPLQFIVEAIAGDRAEVLSVIDQQDSPHNFTISPSDRLAMQRADLLLWIGPEFEFFLADIFQQRARSARVVTALELPGLESIAMGEGLADPHLWLDPVNGALIGRAIASALTELDQSNRDYFEENLHDFMSRLAGLDQEVNERLSGFGARPYVVYHDAYRYFERRFELSRALVLLRNPEVQPSMREILSTRQELRRIRPSCLFMELDADPALLDTLLGDMPVKRAVIDLLGYDIPGGATAYISLIAGVAASFADCLLAPTTAN